MKSFSEKLFEIIELSRRAYMINEDIGFEKYKSLDKTAGKEGSSDSEYLDELLSINGIYSSDTVLKEAINELKYSELNYFLLLYFIGKSGKSSFSEISAFKKMALDISSDGKDEYIDKLCKEEFLFDYLTDGLDKMIFYF